MLVLAVGTVGGTAAIAGAQTTTTSAPSSTTSTSAAPATATTTTPTPSTTATTRPSTAPTVTPPTATGGSIGVQPPVGGPGRGAEPNGPQVVGNDVQAEATDPNGEFTPVTPTRILDTRDGTGGISGPFGSQQTSSTQIEGAGGLPGDGVGAVVLNVTVTGTTAGSFLTLFPSGTGRPFSSNLNWDGGTTIANLVTAVSYTHLTLPTILRV